MSKTRVLELSARKWLAVAALALVSGSTALAQMSVTSSGYITHFDSQPPASEWATMTVAGNAGEVTDVAGMTTTVQGLSASSITAQLGASNVATHAQGQLFGWSSVGLNVQSRPTGVRAPVLLATLQNNSGQDLPSIIVGYNLIVASTVTEQIKGHAVYFSLTGNANDWQLVSGLTDGASDNTAGTYAKSATVSLGNWTQGSLLYLLWADDNGSGSPDTSLKIDDFAVQLAATPVSIVTPPAGQTNAEYSVTTLSVVAGGTGPFTYEWRKNGTLIPSATGAALTVTNTTGSGRTWSRPEDSGNYQVTVSGQAGTPVSATATVLIRPDTNAPTFLWAIADTNAAGALTIRVALSEPLGNPIAEYGDNNANLFWLLNATAGPGGNLGSPDEVLLTNVVAAVNNKTYLEIHFTFASATLASLDPATSYRMVYDNPGTPLYDRAQTPNNMAVVSTPVWAHTAQVLAYDDSWKYSDLDQVPPADWKLPGNNESDPFWKTGPGVFDAKRGATGCRNPTLYTLGNVGTCIVITNLSNPANTNNVPSYYFRTHFQYPYTVQPNAMLKLIGKFDDGAVIWVNGVEVTRIRIPATNDLTHTNYNTAGVSVGDGEGPDNEYVFPASALHSGDNVVAVYLAQVNATSSDITMGLKIISATVAPLAPVVAGPTMNITRSGSDLSISWNPPGGKLVSGPSITGPWTTNASPSNPTTVTPNQNRQFFFISQ